MAWFVIVLFPFLVTHPRRQEGGAQGASTPGYGSPDDGDLDEEAASSCCARCTMRHGPVFRA